MVPTSKRASKKGECHFGKQLEDTDSVYRKHRARLDSLQEKNDGNDCNVEDKTIEGSPNDS
jgi:hypothetical protein